MSLCIRFLCLVSVPLFCILEYLSLFVLIIGSCMGAHLKCRMVSENYVFLPQKTFLFLCIAGQNLLAVRPANFQECVTISQNVSMRANSI